MKECETNGIQFSCKDPKYCTLLDITPSQPRLSNDTKHSNNKNKRKNSKIKNVTKCKIVTGYNIYFKNRFGPLSGNGMSLTEGSPTLAREWESLSEEWKAEYDDQALRFNENEKKIISRRRKNGKNSKKMNTANNFRKNKNRVGKYNYTTMEHNSDDSEAQDIDIETELKEEVKKNGKNSKNRKEASDYNDSLCLPGMTREEYFNKIDSIRIAKNVQFRVAQRIVRIDRLIKQETLRNQENMDEIEVICGLTNELWGVYPIIINDNDNDSDSPEIIDLECTPEARILIENESKTEVIVTDLQSNNQVSIKPSEFGIDSENLDLNVPCNDNNNNNNNNSNSNGSVAGTAESGTSTDTTGTSTDSTSTTATNTTTDSTKSSNENSKITNENETKENEKNSMMEANCTKLNNIGIGDNDSKNENNNSNNSSLTTNGTMKTSTTATEASTISKVSNSGDEFESKDNSYIFKGSDQGQEKHRDHTRRQHQQSQTRGGGQKRLNYGSNPNLLHNDSNHRMLQQQQQWVDKNYKNMNSKSKSGSNSSSSNSYNYWPIGSGYDYDLAVQLKMQQHNSNSSGGTNNSSNSSSNNNGVTTNMIGPKGKKRNGVSNGNMGLPPAKRRKTGVNRERQRVARNQTRTRHQTKSKSSNPQSHRRQRQ